MRYRLGGAWLGRGVWALSDQGLFALSSFGLNVLLARWLAPAEYGAFALAFSVFLFISVFHTSFVSEPMLVFGPTRYRDDPRGYVARLAGAGGALALAASAALAVLLLATRPLWPAGLGATLLGFAIAAPCVLFMWQLRRACYVLGAPRLAASAGGAHLVIVIAIVAALRSGAALSAATAAMGLGAASLIAGGWMAARLGLRWRGLRGGSSLREMASAHWEYGRWSSGAALLSWASANLYLLLLPVWFGLEAAGALSALVSLTMPAIHAEIALSLLVLPALAQRRDQASFGSLAGGSMALLAGGAAAQWLLLGLLHRPLARWIYAGRYDAESSSLWILGLIPVAFAVIAVRGAALRALEQPRRVFAAHLVAAATAIVVGPLLVKGGGLVGAASGYLLSYVLTAAALLLQGTQARVTSGARARPLNDASLP